MTEVTSIRARMKHIRQAKLCAGGARDWWKHRGLDWNDFLTNGIPIETLLETGDPDAKRVAELARNDHVS